MEATTPRTASFPVPHPSARPRLSPSTRITAGAARSLSLHRRRTPFSLRASSANPSGAGRLDPPQDPGPVEVIGIGSRKDAVLNFCLQSSLASSSRRLRYWIIHSRESLKVTLLQRHQGTDVRLRNVEFPLALSTCPPAVILVASAGHGSDHITAAELLDAVKSAGGLAAAIILKPFSFEGQRRQEEVDKMVNKLQECSHFYIVVEADSLLKTEVETFAEALESANNAAFLAINTVSTLMSEEHPKFLITLEEETKEVKPLEIVKLLESYREAKVCFGAGYNIRAAIKQAVFQCPFLSGGIKDIKGLVIFTLSSACTLDDRDFLSVILTFRRITGYTSEIIFSKIHEPDLEPNLVVTTLLILGCNEKKISEQNFLSHLAVHFRSMFSLLGRESPERGILSVNRPSQPSADIISLDSLTSMSNHVSGPDVVTTNSDIVHSEETVQPSRESSSENISIIKSSEVSHESLSESDNHIYEEFQEYNSLNNGPGFNIAQLWAKERSSTLRSNKPEQDVFTLPIGVKSTDISSVHSPNFNLALEETLDDMNRDSVDTPNLPSIGSSADSGLEAILDIYNSALTLLKQKNIDESRNRGLLSVRAASMLEAERESEKSWTPIMEMQYRGGTYRGRCQGGLPEGKGRLIYADGSFYDGLWRYGKKSGLGTFCYCNGDVFQGTWRDDLMHGKGWFYFHTGDRWFANFWKGKANGEGRFYAKNGSIFYGNFQNGWRHGKSLFIDVDGVRYTEIWDQGVLRNRIQMAMDHH